MPGQLRENREKVRIPRRIKLRLIPNEIPAGDLLGPRRIVARVEHGMLKEGTRGLNLAEVLDAKDDGEEDDGE